MAGRGDEPRNPKDAHAFVGGGVDEAASPKSNAADAGARWTTTRRRRSTIEPTPDAKASDVDSISLRVRKIGAGTAGREERLLLAFLLFGRLARRCSRRRCGCVWIDGVLEELCGVRIQILSLSYSHVGRARKRCSNDDCSQKCDFAHFVIPSFKPPNSPVSQNDAQKSHDWKQVPRPIWAALNGRKSNAVAGFGPLAFNRLTAP